MLRHGSAPWQLWAFALACAVPGLRLWHGQGKHFGLLKQAERDRPVVAYGSLLACLALILGGLDFGR